MAASTELGRVPRPNLHEPMTLDQKLKTAQIIVSAVGAISLLGCIVATAINASNIPLDHKLGKDLIITTGSLTLLSLGTIGVLGIVRIGDNKEKKAPTHDEASHDDVEKENSDKGEEPTSDTEDLKSIGLKWKEKEIDEAAAAIRAAEEQAAKDAETARLRAENERQAKEEVEAAEAARLKEEEARAKSEADAAAEVARKAEEVRLAKIAEAESYQARRAKREETRAERIERKERLAVQAQEKEKAKENNNFSNIIDKIKRNKNAPGTAEDYERKIDQTLAQHLSKSHYIKNAWKNVKKGDVPLAGFKGVLLTRRDLHTLENRPMLIQLVQDVADYLYIKEKTISKAIFDSAIDALQPDANLKIEDKTLQELQSKIEQLLHDNRNSLKVMFPIWNRCKGDKPYSIQELKTAVKTWDNSFEKKDFILPLANAMIHYLHVKAKLNPKNQNS